MKVTRLPQAHQHHPDARPVRAATAVHVIKFFRQDNRINTIDGYEKDPIGFSEIP